LCVKELLKIDFGQLKSVNRLLVNDLV